MDRTTPVGSMARHFWPFRRNAVVLFLVTCLVLSGNAHVVALPGSQFQPDGETTVQNAWTSFSTSDGLAANSILAVGLDGGGTLWAGTTGGASARLADGSWHTFTDANGLGGNIVTDIARMPGQPSQRWFSAYGGIALFDDGGNIADVTGHKWVTFTTSDGLVAEWASTIAIDQVGRLWVGTYFIDTDGNDKGYGVSRLDTMGTPFAKADDVWTTFTTSSSYLSNNLIRDILVDEAGVIWIATLSGLNAYFNDSWTVFRTSNGLPSNEVTSLALHDGLLWIATTGGIAVLDYNSTVQNMADDRWAVFRQNNGLVDNETSSITIDDAGYVWIGTSRKTNSGEAGSGVSVLDYNDTPFDSTDDFWRSFTTANGLAHQAVRAVASIGTARVMFGTRSGLSELDYGSTPFHSSDNHWVTHTDSEHLVGHMVNAIVAGPGAEIWMGTEQGINLLNYAYTPREKDDDTWTRYYLPSGGAVGSVSSLALDPRARLWVGTTAGLWIIDSRGTPDNPSDDIVRQYMMDSGLVHDQINDIVVDSLGRGWISCGNYFGGGLQMLDPGASLSSIGDDLWATFTPLNSPLPGAYVTSAALGQSDTVWIGTTEGAAQLQYGASPLFKADDKWTIFKKAADGNGLAYDNVRDVVVDDAGNVWFGLLLSGVSVRSNSGQWRTFGQADGLVYESVSELAVDSAKRLWIGTDGGGISVLDYGASVEDKADDRWTSYLGGNPLLSGNVRAINMDRWGQVWVGTFGGGASVRSEVEFSLIRLPIVRRR